jgi:hypothetical protein
MEFIKIFRVIEISTDGDQSSLLPQSFDFAIQRMEGLATYVDFISKYCVDEGNHQREEKIFLPLEISRRNLLLIEMDQASQNDVELF